MSILNLIPRPVSIPSELEDRWNEQLAEMHCLHCRTAMWVRNDDPQLPVCGSCAKAQAESAAHSSLAIVADLVRGCGEFSAWGCDERRELLRQHGLDIEPDRNGADSPTAEERDEIESRIELESVERWEWTMR